MGSEIRNVSFIIFSLFSGYSTLKMLDLTRKKEERSSNQSAIPTNTFILTHINQKKKEKNAWNLINELIGLMTFRKMRSFINYSINMMENGKNEEEEEEEGIYMLSFQINC